MFDPAAGDTAGAATASTAVWFDAFVMNVDRTARNANLLRWHQRLYFIDQGASLYWHHNWKTAPSLVESRFPAIRQHLLLPWATQLDIADAAAHARLSAESFAPILDQVPDAWLLPGGSPSTDAHEQRERYIHFLTARLSASAKFIEEAIYART
ncbi:hypothetical protein [Acidisarcina polymorpha]|uniref:hypothetical protein n=1 Tax=Acidisarcina polymorpha TaxID=2211140 RepID=UPI001F2EF2D2|nr:hypothetical protein [Acidisarcina polymorpha]